MKGKEEGEEIRITKNRRGRDKEGGRGERKRGNEMAEENNRKLQEKAEKETRDKD